MLLYWIWLNELVGIGPILAKRLLDIFDNPEEIYKASLVDLKAIDGIGINMANKILDNKSTDKANKILEKCYKNNIKILTLNDELYHNRFKYKGSPIILYYKGSINNCEKIVSVVGTRNCTEYGKQVTRDITKYLIDEGNIILSGLSKGIEAVAHTITVKNNGRAMAFLPCGIDYIYPKEHKSLIEAIGYNGILISEYPPGDTIKKSYFLERNKRMMEWSDNVIIVEAPENSATFATVEYADKISKKVYAIPHSIYSKEGQGTNNLIYNKKAELFLPKLKPLNQNKSEKGNSNLNEIQRKIILVLKNRQIYVEELKAELKISEAMLLNELFMLELMGQLQIRGGKVDLKTTECHECK
jgi:DNA processing protein